MTFTDKKPTVPGAYWYKAFQDSKPLLVCVSETPEYAGLPEMVVSGRGMRDEYLSDIGGLWSSRLVPADECVKGEEVESAWNEGFRSVSHDYENAWKQSRARRVIEGKEGV